MTKIILQKSVEATPESRCIHKLAMLDDSLEIIECCIKELVEFIDELYQGAMPVGSVEFVAYAMKLIGLQEPKFDCYPRTLSYERKISKINKYKLFDINPPFFVKPVKTKLFTGVVYKGDDLELYDDYDREQLETLLKLKDDVVLYIADVVKFEAEWRCYIKNGKLVKTCQYDDNVEDLDPDIEFVNQCLAKLKYRTLALDIGLLDNDKYCVVELNDAWGLGKYYGIDDKDYLDILLTRWKEIVA